MSESLAIEIYENEEFVWNEWRPHGELHWTYKTQEKCASPEEYQPSVGWIWVSNWRIDKRMDTDRDGWEYASVMTRFLNEKRKTKTEKLWSDKARRRLWTRIMKRDVHGVKTDLTKLMPKIQAGLKGLQSARIRIEEIVKHHPDSIQSEQMQDLVTSVKSNISDINKYLDQVENSQTASSSSHAAVIKKLRNDVTREEIAIDRALYPNSTTTNVSSSVGRVGSNNRGSVSSGFVPLRKLGSNNGSFGNNRRGSLRHNTTGGEQQGGDSGSGDTVVASSFGVGSYNNSAVKSGRADAFDPFVLGNNSKSNSDGLEDGMFIERSVEERRIIEKLKVVEESDIMAEIIEERSEEIMKVHKVILIHLRLTHSLTYSLTYRV